MCQQHLCASILLLKTHSAFLLFQMALSQFSSGDLDSMSCRICMERFDSNSHVPKLLPCQHTVCRNCIEKDAISIRYGLITTEITCPVCRNIHTVSLDGLSTNHGVLDIVEEFCKEKVSNEPVLMCAEHEDVPSV